jgi:hypothetical protein
MKKNVPTNRYLTAAVAGLLAGSSLLAGSAGAQVKKPESSPTPSVEKPDKNTCSGPNGCGSKSQKAGPADADRHACKGQNACKGKGGCKSGDNGCAGKNSCKGKGGCAVPAKATPTPGPAGKAA